MKECVVKSTGHQQRAAQSRHAHTTAAKLQYQSTLTERLKDSPLLAKDPRRFASSERKGIVTTTAQINRDFALCLKQSTIKTWLREWSKAAQVRMQALEPRWELPQRFSFCQQRGDYNFIFHGL